MFDQFRCTHCRRMASSGMITLAIPYLFARHVHLQGIQHTPLGCVFPVVFPRSLDTLLPHVAIPPQHTHSHAVALHSHTHNPTSRHTCHLHTVNIVVNPQCITMVRVYGPDGEMMQTHDEEERWGEWLPAAPDQAQPDAVAL